MVETRLWQTSHCNMGYVYPTYIHNYIALKSLYALGSMSDLTTDHVQGAVILLSKEYIYIHT